MKVVGFIDEAPFDASTWSGSSYYFFSALKKANFLNAAFATEPPVAAQLLAKVRCIHPNLSSWRFRYHLDVNHYKQRTRVMRRRLTELPENSFDGILQVGAWYNGPAVRDELCRDKFVASYHDGNLATLIGSPYGHPPIDESYLRRTLAYEKGLYQRIDVIFPMSRWLSDSFIEENEVPPDRVVPVGAGVNLPYLGDTSEKTYDEPTILFVGKQFERKGGTDLLTAFRSVSEAMPEARLQIIGPEAIPDVPGAECLGPLSKSSPAELERLIEAYRQAAVFVLPSRYEPFGIALVEAMAHRLPCIGTNICAIPEIISDGETGFTVPVADSNSLADKLLALLSQPDLCRAMGAAGYEKYQHQFTWDAVIQKIGGELQRRFG